MTDINLLPPEQRKKELVEKKMAEKIKNKASFVMSDPANASKDRPLIGQGDFKKPNFFNWLKKSLQKRKIKKQEAKLKKSLREQDRKAEEEKKEQIKKNELKYPDAISGKNSIHIKPVEPQKKEDLYYKIDVNRSKIEDFNKKEKTKYTSGKEIDDSFDVNLMPDIKRVWEIAFKVKIVSLVAVLVFVIVVVAGIFVWFDSQINKEMEKVTLFDKRIELLNEKQSSLVEINKEAVFLQKHLDVLGDLLDKHVYVSKLFTYLEETVVPGVYYETINLDKINNIFSVNIIALNYTEAAKQILVFEEDKDNIKAVKVNSLDLFEKTEKQTEGSSTSSDQEAEVKKFVEFSLDIFLAPDFFNE